jgi:hypothetical protein
MPLSMCAHTVLFLIFFLQVVFVHCLGGYQFDWDSEVLWVIQGCVEIKIGYVHGAKFCLGGGDYAVEQNLGGFQLSCYSGLSDCGVSTIVHVLVGDR